MPFWDYKKIDQKTILSNRVLKKIDCNCDIKHFSMQAYHN